MLRRRDLIVTMILGAAGHAAATERFALHLGVENGLTAEWVTALAQDRDGLIWVGTVGGLFRFDGTEFRRIAPEIIPSRWVQQIAPTPDGAIYVVDNQQHVFRVASLAATSVNGPDSRPLTARTISVDADGTLYAAHDRGLLRRRLDGSWSSVPAELFGSSPVYSLLVERSGELLVGTHEGIWRLDAAQHSSQRLTNSGVATHLAEGATRSFALVQTEHDVTLLTVQSHSASVCQRWPYRGFSLAVRDDTAWVQQERRIWRVAPGQPAELVFSLEHGDEPGGTLLVDRDRALWRGTEHGLSIYGEPDAYAFTRRDGIEEPSGRWLSLVGSQLWWETWSWGVYQSSLSPGGFTVPKRATSASKRWCVDDRGRGWAVDDGAVLLKSGDSTQRFAFARVEGRNWCTASSRGTVVLHTPHEARASLAVVDAGSSKPQRFDLHSSHGAPLEGSLLTHDDIFWSSYEDGSICAVPLAALRERDQRWQCSRLAGSPPASRLVESRTGAIWASSPDGVFRWDGERWCSIAASLRLPTQFAWLAPGRDGTIWVMGADILHVEDRPDLTDGWLVLERYAALPGVQWASDLIELPDKSLAISSVRGLVYVPAAARNSVSRVPPVVLTDVRRDGQSMLPGTPVELPHRAAFLELQVAAPIYVDRGPLRFRARTHADQPWSIGKGPTFSFIDLPFGRYRAEVQASLDGEHWSESPVVFDFTVAPPWYLQWWSISAAALSLIALLTLAYKLRVAMFLRLERQRARIARDLHDELGSGLGSIGILAGVMAEGEAQDPTKTRSVAATILQTAEELGTALTDIAWALRPGEATLAGLARHLRERAQRLVTAHSQQLKFEFQDPLPELALSLPVRRILFLIGCEALHNAVRHAEAQTITLSLRAVGRRWCLAIRDDGRGLASTSQSALGHGEGLAGIRHRAAEIGAHLEIHSEPGVGTSVVVTFDPAAEDRPVTRTTDASSADSQSRAPEETPPC